MWRNDIKCEYMFMFTLKNLARKELGSSRKLSGQLWMIPMQVTWKLLQPKWDLTAAVYKYAGRLPYCTLAIAVQCSWLTQIWPPCTIIATCALGCLRSMALSYYSVLTPWRQILQAFQPMATQLSKKAVLPLAKILATASCLSKTWPWAQVRTPGCPAQGYNYCN